MRPNTRVVFLKSPGSLTFEIQDVPAIAAAAKEAGAVVMLDNTWATPLFFRSFDHGVDLSIHAATKYIVGHSDAMLGVITARTPELWNRLKRYAVSWAPAPARTTSIWPARPADHGAPGSGSIRRPASNWPGGFRAARRWRGVLHPALPDDPGHALWRRDFQGPAACSRWS